MVSNVFCVENTNNIVCGDNRTGLIFAVEHFGMNYVDFFGVSVEPFRNSLYA